MFLVRGASFYYDFGTHGPPRSCKCMVSLFYHREGGIADLCIRMICMYLSATYSRTAKSAALDAPISAWDDIAKRPSSSYSVLSAPTYSSSPSLLVTAVTKLTL